MKKILIITSVAIYTLSAGSLSAVTNSTDSDGCWDALTRTGSKCLKGWVTWSKSTKGKVFLNLTNSCHRRVYVKTCNKKTTGNWDCGSQGLGAGRTTKYYTYNATGQSTWITVGSVKPNSDWVCAGKIQGWRKFPR